VGYAENRRGYWRGRYKITEGKHGTVTDATGATVRFRTKRAAIRAADAEEAKVYAGGWRDPASGQLTFGATRPGGTPPKISPRPRCRTTGAAW
jgi:hypothetical protein